MADQLFDTYRKASESWMQMQQDLFRNAGQPSFFAPPPGMAGGPDWARNAHKRWAELTGEMLNRQRESVDALYKSLIQAVEQASRISEAKSSEDYRRATEEIWGKWFESVKNHSEAQFRDAQTFAGKSMEFGSSP
ncbi:MAG TPA: hypothetical protein VH853_20890 [Polyangia bacterium]|jgi:hypothetical protein|nr:hypothetical protein [Polyangia bacterium]